jgi:hypothetical protein
MAGVETGSTGVCFLWRSAKHPPRTRGSARVGRNWPRSRLFPMQWLAGNGREVQDHADGRRPTIDPTEWVALAVPNG